MSTKCCQEPSKCLNNKLSIIQKINTDKDETAFHIIFSYCMLK